MRVNETKTGYELGQVDAAIREYRAALQTHPDSATIHYNLAVALSGQGRLTEAAQSLEQAIRYAPNYFEAHLKLGQILAQTGDRARAEEHLRKAAESPDPQVRAAARSSLSSQR